MIPVGYMAKRVEDNPFWLDEFGVKALYSVSSCFSEDFADFIDFWKHNDYWFFDSPEMIKTLASEHKLPLEGTTFFYYELYPKEYDGTGWIDIDVESNFLTDVQLPKGKTFHGFDVVSYSVGTSAECSPLSCNSLAKSTKVNEYCLFDTFIEAFRHLEEGFFDDSEPEPFRVLSVYTVSLNQFYGAN